MRSPTYELGYLKGGLEVFKTYLSSKQLFFPINTPSPYGEPAYPRLTLGGVLLAVRYLKALELSKNQATELSTQERLLDHWRTTRKVAWERKAQKELASRMRQWKLYLGELRQEPDRYMNFYTSEVRIRVMIELLKGEVTPMPNEIQGLLQDMDGMLRTFLKQGDFIWEAELAPEFPPETYWFLWGSPQIGVCLY